MDESRMRVRNASNENLRQGSWRERTRAGGRAVVVYTEQPTRDLLFFLRCRLLLVSLHKSAQRMFFCIMGVGG